MHPTSARKAAHQTFGMLLGMVLVALSGWTSQAADAPPSRHLRTEANVPVEITLVARKAHPDPFQSIEVDLLLPEPNGLTRRVPAFWAGGSTWKVRYASARVGRATWRSEGNDASDPGLHGVRGMVEVTPYHGSNPLFQHGPVRITPDHRRFEHADGTPFFWLGDTWWMGLCHRLRWPEDFQKLAADRVAKGFNVVQLVAGLYPDMHPFDPRGANEAGFPWEKDYASIRPEYFDAADQRLRYLIDQGLTPCLVGAWGYFLPWMGQEKMKAHWRYLIARYAAWPVIWCAAGEANLPWYLAKGFPFDDQEQARGWCEVMRFIRVTDPWRRPLTVHPTAINAYTARHVAEAAKLMDFDFLQTPHGQREAAPAAVETVLHSRSASPTLPVVNGEASYEMLMDSLPTRWTRAMFWLCVCSGSAGHTYGANGIWQCNRPGQPHGPSPTAGAPATGYGIITWEEAMNLPGSRQIGAAKQWLMKLPWWTFEPHPDWTTWADAGEAPPAFGSWIWREAEAQRSAPVATRYFRRTFTIEAGRSIRRARLYASADDAFRAWLNGGEAGSAASWKEPLLTEVTKLLHPGRNVLAIRAKNSPAPVTENPAGLNAVLEVEFQDGTRQRIATDGSWRAADEEVAGWRDAKFDDENWAEAAVLGQDGMGPWGRLTPSNPVAPCTLGSQKGPRLVYLLDAKPIQLHQLDPGRVYDVTPFDPVAGQELARTQLTADARGEATLLVPAYDHDHAVLLMPHLR